MNDLSERINVPVENILTPDYLRRVLWSPPPGRPESLPDAVAAELTRLGARGWQVELAEPVITAAIIDPQLPETDD